MTVEEIIKTCLIENDYDGLVTYGCYCRVENLFGCETNITQCKAGHLNIMGRVVCMDLGEDT